MPTTLALLLLAGEQPIAHVLKDVGWSMATVLLGDVGGSDANPAAYIQDFVSILDVAERLVATAFSPFLLLAEANLTTHAATSLPRNLSAYDTSAAAR